MREDDTARIVIAERARSEYQDVRIEPGEQMELVICPSEPMQRPALSMVGDGDVSVEQVAVGHFVVFTCPGKVSDYRCGREVPETVSERDPLRILLHNRTDREVRIGASLISIERPGAYRITSKE